MALRELIIHDVWWKIFSVALAVVIWVTVNPVSQDERHRTINPLGTSQVRVFTNMPVVVRSSATNLQAFSISPETVEVTIGGRSEFVNAVTEHDISVTVDLTDIESARALRKRVDVVPPPGVTFIKAFPSHVDVTIPSKKSN